MKSQWEVELLRSMTEVQEQVIQDVEPRVVFDNLLRHLLTLTESEYGFIGQILYTPQGAPYLKTHAISNVAWDEETRAFYDKHAPQGMEFHNLQTLFGAAITSEQPVIANAPARDPRSGGCPVGHPALRAFLGVPFHRRDRLIGMVGAANRPGGYDEELVTMLKPFLSVCASLIEAFETQRKREKAEAALRESEQRYRRLVEDQPELLCRFQPDFTLTFVNRAYAHYFGRTVAECEGLNFLELIPESDRDAVCERIRSIDRDRPLHRNEHQVIGAHGDLRWMQWTNRALFDERGEIREFQSLGLDITDRKRAESERREFEAKLRQVQKLESLGVLAGGMAHDFNNLLTGILGNASLALMDLPADSPTVRNLKQIEEASLQAADLCAQMLAYSGRGAFVTQAVHLSTLVEEMVRMLEHGISKKATLELDLPADIPAVEADLTQLRQVLMNLITNASDALEGRVGTVRVSTGVRYCSREELQTSLLDDDLPAGSYVFVEVTDDGSGMDEDTVAKIFDPFFSTKFAGRGLGLAAVLGIVRGHRGAIRVRSAPGQGTTISILLPASTRPAEHAPDGAQPQADGEREGLILVIDDEELVRAVARDSLRSRGFDVLLARDGQEGLEFFRQRHDEISVVVVDLTMPKLGGDEVVHEIRRIRSDARVILSSGFKQQEVTERLSGERPCGFLQKPYRASDLLLSIDASLADPD